MRRRCTSAVRYSHRIEAVEIILELNTQRLCSNDRSLIKNKSKNKQKRTKGSQRNRISIRIFIISFNGLVYLRARIHQNNSRKTSITMLVPIKIINFVLVEPARHGQLLVGEAEPIQIGFFFSSVLYASFLLRPH